MPEFKKIINDKLRITLVCLVLLISFSCNTDDEKTNMISMTKAELKDKIKGGWAGQVIGVTYGGPTEFRYLQKIIPDSVELRWDNELVTFFYDTFPGLYDDIYMDLTFVEVFEKEGLDAPASSHANAFANAGYILWHANQAARYNILNGIMPPASGHWRNNMHANDIDFQIEADFAGLMSPGMVNVSSEICDKIGHIMNYGDGYYGGVYVAAMYALAFVHNDVQHIINEALKVIPEESNYYKCMQDVINFHKKYPNDWKKAWQAIEDSEWSTDLYCPDGILTPFNIDATVNSAYVLLGMLYGEGDLKKTMDISTRAGQDSDCNPATAAGILCTMMGYNNIPDYWKQPILPVEDRNFQYTSISLNDVYDMGYKQALQVIERNGGKVGETQVSINYQTPNAVPLEVSFPDIYPVKVTRGNNLFTLKSESPLNIDFSGVGFVVEGSVNGELEKDYVAQLEVKINGEVDKVMRLPVDYRTRSEQLYWNVEIPKGEHTATLKWLNPVKGGEIDIRGYIEFDNIKKTIQEIQK